MKKGFIFITTAFLFLCLIASVKPQRESVLVKHLNEATNERLSDTERIKAWNNLLKEAKGKEDEILEIYSEYDELNIDYISTLEEVFAKTASPQHIEKLFNHKDPRIRHFAICSLQFIQDAKTRIDLRLKSLQDPSNEESAINEASYDLDNSDVVSIIQKKLDTGNEATQIRCLWAFASSDNPRRFTKAFTDALKSGTEEKTVIGLRVFAEYPEKNVFDLIKGLMKNSNNTIRLFAAKAMSPLLNVTFPNEKSLPQEIKANLIKQLSSDSSIDVIQEIAKIFSAFPNTLSSKEYEQLITDDGTIDFILIDGLLQSYRDSDKNIIFTLFDKCPSIRSKIINFFSIHKNMDFLPLALAGTKDANPATRIAGMLGLLRFEYKDLPKIAKKISKESDNIFVRDAAEKVYIYLTDKNGREKLEHIIINDNTDFMTRKTCLDILIASEYADNVSFLKRFVATSASSHTYLLPYLIENMDVKSAGEYLTTLFEHENHYVRAGAYTYLNYLIEDRFSGPSLSFLPWRQKEAIKNICSKWREWWKANEDRIMKEEAEKNKDNVLQGKNK